MPKPFQRRSAIRNPVDLILGSATGVAILRTLTTAQVPLSQSELARRAGIHLRGVPAALASLEAVGVISYAGRGRTRQVQLNHRYPLLSELRNLFNAEVMRWNRIIQGLREAAGGFQGGLISAWIEGSVAEESDTTSDPIEVTFMFEQLADDGLQANVRQRVNAVQQQEHAIVALRFHQRADLLRLTAERRDRLAHALLLYGPAPLDLSPADVEPVSNVESSTPTRSHGGVSIAERVASKLVHDPEIAIRARDYVDRRLAIAAGTERNVLLEWKGLLDTLTPGQLALLLRDKTERGDRLRQSLPFVGVLDDDEAT